MPLGSYALEKTPSSEEIAIYKNDIERVEKYLNGIDTLIAAFSQVDSAGNATEGTFYLDRPGKLRWQYYPPSPLLIIAKGSMLTYYDKELDQVSHIPLEDSISGFLTRDNIRFISKDIEIISYEKTDDEIAITISQKGARDNGELTLIFTNKKIELKKMQILDAIGKTTDIYFSTLIYGKPIDRDLFIFNKDKEKR